MNHYAIVDEKGIFRGILFAKSETMVLRTMISMAGREQSDFGDEYDDDNPCEIKRVVSMELSEVREYHVRVFYVEDMSSFYSDEAPNALVSENPVVWMPV